MTEIYKFEFTKDIKHSIHINQDIVKCSAKTAGKIENDFFTAKLNFTINSITKNITDIKITNIYIVDDITTKSSTDVIKETLEQNIFNILGGMLQNVIFDLYNVIFINTNVDFLVLYLKLNSENYLSNSSNSSNSSLKNNDNNVENDNNSKNDNNIENDNNVENVLIEKEEINDNDISKAPIINSKIKNKKKPINPNILKLVNWAIVVSFILYIFKKNKRNVIKTHISKN